jgi:CdiI immunity protein
MTLFDETPTLQQLLKAYFHEDWTMDRRNYAEVVREFIDSEPREVVSAAGAEARALLAQPVTDDTFEQSLADVGCNFYLPTAGLPARAWLSEVAGLLEAAV